MDSVERFRKKITIRTQGFEMNKSVTTHAIVQRSYCNYSENINAHIICQREFLKLTPLHLFSLLPWVKFRLTLNSFSLLKKKNHEN